MSLRHCEGPTTRAHCGHFQCLSVLCTSRRAGRNSQVNTAGEGMPCPPLDFNYAVRNRSLNNPFLPNTLAKVAHTEFQHRQADCELRNTGQVCPLGDGSNYCPAGMSSKYILSQAQVWRDPTLLLSSKVRFCCGARVGRGGRYEACCLPVTSCFQGMRGPHSRWQWGCKGESWWGCPGAASSSTES